MMHFIYVIIVLGFGFVESKARDSVIMEVAPSNWSQGHVVSQPRMNPYNLSEEEFLQFKQQGQWLTHSYPVTVTGLLPPYRPIERILNDDFNNPIKKWLNSLFKSLTQIKSFDGLMNWLGLNPFPERSEKEGYSVFLPEGKVKPKFLGMDQIEHNNALGFSLSCATCHTSQLFGKTVFGLTNRFPRANEFFIRAKVGVTLLEENFFKYYSGANPAEMELFSSAKKNIKAVGLKKPIALGLDTSLAQVALSLSKRNPDGIASRSQYFEKHPRHDYLDDYPADSKPAVWWNLKYKNRWLSDGSVVSGNPIYTNILWNELGRGVDLLELEQWLEDNEKIVAELSTAVFSSEAPRITDFFSEAEIDIAAAKRGETLFNEVCSSCHGTYKKNWSLPNAEAMSLTERIKTSQVYYPKQTKVKNVGTDPYRYLGMKSLEKLNSLAISQKNNILIQAQVGYVPPPLVGIWARWPYFHNNSVPSLCELLKPSAQRVKQFYQGPARNKNTDFDKVCNGYPVPEKAPVEWKRTRELKVDTSKKGLGNFGHDEGIFIENGKELLNQDEKMDLIKYLQTL
jgi:hypothetical protein